ncbi:MAG: molybdopterin-dependent oxidoreductase [Bacteroidetes bacterium]|nr:molybdopterin-dependent oxidoreductase [Bacteroidota bacterium]MBL6943295.1 molybdopterin-dependent oxidoreductase [Bacteroidales bacterium]
MKNIDSINHVQGKSIFIDDITVNHGTLYGVVFGSPFAYGKITKLNIEDALKIEGVIRIFTYHDIPGVNQIGAIIQDETLFAESEVHYVGQPIALIVAETEKIAQKARDLIYVDLDEYDPIIEVSDAKEKQQFIMPPRTFKLGDTKAAWNNCEHIFEGKATTGGQEHLYLETQGSYAIPQENGNIKIFSSTQGPTAIQKIGAKVLGIPMNKIEVDVVRLGGAFGGKEEQATLWAIMTALAVYHLHLPVKLILSRNDDMFMTGKRHPYETQFKIGLSGDLKILAFEADYLQNAGASADLSPAITERTLFHSTNSYFVPNVKATVYTCKTNLPPNTAFRGFGAPQGIFVIEAAINHASNKLNIPAREIQKINLLKENDEFPYGQAAKDVELTRIWNTAQNNFNISKLEKEVSAFNNSNELKRRGISLTPITFGISFTNTMMNHARALVHIYQDGSIGISTGAVEMGQSVNTKMVQIAAKVLSVVPERIKIESTNTTRVANTSPTAASSTADLNGKAVQQACDALLKRLKSTAAANLKVKEDMIHLRDEAVFIDNEKTSLTWEQLVWKAFANRVSLTENCHYSTPKIYFNKAKGKGHPFSYHVYGLAITTVTVDCISGSHEVDSVKIVHDFGKSMNQEIDNGQIEGAVVQGIGWMTMEEIVFDEKGRLQSNALSTYKIPDIYSAPNSIEIIPLETESNDEAILKSKAVGEPPFIYGIGSFFALQDAIRAFNPSYKSEFDAPLTPEKVLLGLYEE